jgi:hypothetical protein
LVRKRWNRVNMELFCTVSLITAIVVFGVMTCNVVGSLGPIVFRGSYEYLQLLTEMYGIITMKIANGNRILFRYLCIYN